ncbi:MULTISPECIES: hypothetical protein [Mycolicibacterium]|uniref:hypothetical protein n=1 Tax=Mycolicibacterium monacense TaxID=85693 RepID=UPI0007EBF8A2|nr:hypothetical protein [Mycolicibacterium monacense]OBB77625.1 PE-PPE domain-containing protein [Mycolicibacterium monacense]
MGKHHTKHFGKRAKKAALAGTVAATAAALTMGLTAPSASAAAVARSQQAVALAALPDDLSGLNLAAVLESLGIAAPDLGDLLTLPSIPLPTGGNLDLPVKVITTGPPFGALGLLGFNSTWVPAFPDRIADEINDTPYGRIDTDFSVPLPNNIYQAARNAAYALALLNATKPVAEGGGGCSSGFAGLICRANFAAAARDAVPDDVSAPILLPNLRIPIVIAFGLGSLATGMAYPDVVADLPNQPGGTNADPALGSSSLTILPMILLRNPGRADGGIAARFAPILDPILEVLGQNSVVTPDGQVETDGGAVLVPIKVDGTVEYDPLSDFAAWPNPFTLANNGAAFLFPTYILRGADVTGAVDDLLTPVVGGVLTNVVSNAIGTGLPINVPVLGQQTIPRSVLAPLVSQLLGIPLPAGTGTDPGRFSVAINSFFTVESDALPLLEPFRYPTDFANLFTGGVFGFSNPFADAVEPALKILVNLGYTNVTQDMSNPLDPYPRDFSGNFGSEYAPFLTLPEGIDWGQVPEDLFTAFAAGVQSAFFSGGIPGVHPGVPVANPLAILAGLLGLDGGIPGLPDLLTAFPDLADILGANLGLPELNSTTLAAATAPAVGGADDPLTRLGETLARTLHFAFEREAPVPYTPPTSPVDSAFDVTEGLSASGLRLLAATVLGPTRLAALAEGGPEALADLIENTVDAPLWVADPALYGFRDALPADLAGGVTDFRDGLWALTQRINEALLGALDDLPNPPADVTITSDQARAGGNDPQIEATLRSAGSVQPAQPSGDLETGQPGQELNHEPVVIPEGDNGSGDKGDQKVTNGARIKGGHLSKAIEKSINDTGKAINDAVAGTQKTLTKVFTPKTSVKKDDAPQSTQTEDKPDADKPAA